MSLFTVLVSYQRLPLLKRTVASYRDTVTGPHRLIVVDNGSSGKVTGWLAKNFPNRDVIYLPENHYPGRATNLGFATAPPDATLLHRSDNDMEYLPGWRDRLEEAFEADLCLEPGWSSRRGRLGIVGLRTTEEELGAPANTGGTAVWARKMWDAGLRYTEKPWTELGGHTEDYWICRDGLRKGFGWGRVTKPCVVHIATGDWNDPYYAESYGIRGIVRPG